MEERLPRKLAAILYADVAGYSRLTGADEDATHRVLSDYLDVIADTIESHQGRVMHYAGDAVLARFDAVVNALSSSVAIQDALRTRNETLPDDRKVRFRIGVNLGDVIEDRGDLYGNGVNVAARLEGLAEPGGVCVADAVRTAVGQRLRLRYAFIGEHRVKNIEEPIRAYRVFEPDAESTASPSPLAPASSAVSALRFGKPSVTIKPFEDIGAESEQDRLGDGFTNGIAAALTRVPGLVLVADESPGLAESKQMTAEEIRLRFGVRYVLNGTVRKLGNRVRVDTKLLEAPTGLYVWADVFDRDFHDFGDFFAIQDEISDEIVTAMDVKLLGGEAARFVRKSLKDPAALESYYRGEELLWRSTNAVEFREAQRLFEETIRLEPGSPVGYAAGALTYWVETLSGFNDTPPRSLDRAVELAREAIRLDDVTGYAHLVMAHVHLTRRHYDEALAEATNAVLDRPSCPAAYSLKASVLTFLGRATEAIDLAQFSSRLTPVHPGLYPAILASAYYSGNRYEEALASAQSAMDLASKEISCYAFSIASNVALNRMGEARNTATEVLNINPDFTLAAFARTQPYKDPETLDKLLARLRSAGLQ